MRSIAIRSTVPEPGHRYAPVMKTIWAGRAAQAAARYGEHAPTAAVCCNACRTCVQTNLIAAAIAGLAAAGAWLTRLARRPVRKRF
jgi:hypothetical protein